MRKGLISIAVVGALAVPALAATPGTADPLGICPDNMFIFPDSAVPSGTQKDHNGNGFICAKVSNNGSINGGPDDNSVVDDSLS
jgi:hypothetical protein